MMLVIPLRFNYMLLFPYREISSGPLAKGGGPHAATHKGPKARVLFVRSHVCQVQRLVSCASSAQLGDMDSSI